MKDMKFIIIGAGPTGLAAAYRLKELGHTNFIIYEKNSYVGGLCASFVDAKSFTWDKGGHVIFSRYEYFNNLLNIFLGHNILEHMRNSWIRTKNRWIPYPFQNNIRYLSLDKFLICIISAAMARAMSRIRRNRKPRNFKEWIIDTFGIGVAYYFLLPYNFKVWHYPLDELSVGWIGERLSRPRLRELINNIMDDRDSINWGLNAKFKYPSYGGIGEVFRKMSMSLIDKIVLAADVVKINPDKKEIYLGNGLVDNYNILINTSPLDRFLASFNRNNNKLLKASSELKHNGVFVVGLGINKKCYDNKCWVYFPDTKSPFFRVTYSSNYSPYNVPDIESYRSLLCEIAYYNSIYMRREEVVEKTIQNLINFGILDKDDRKDIVSKFIFDIEYAYPIPTIRRDEVLYEIQSELENKDIYSRGRFGAWKYEIGNMDHSVMQGKEIIDRIVSNRKETIYYV